MQIETETVFLIFELSSIILMLVSYILIIIQSFNNYNFRNCKTKEMIVERLLYENFVDKVDHNINSYSYTISSDSEYSDYSYSDYRFYMPILIRSETYYDCKGVFDNELNEKICQNQIIKNNTCCRADCCWRNNGNEIFCYNYSFDYNNVPNKNKILIYNDEEIFEDPRRRLCSYENRYNRIDYFRNRDQKDITEIGLKRFDYNYIDLFELGSKLVYIGKENVDESIYDVCGQIDTKGNYLFVQKGMDCPIQMDKSNNKISYTSKERDSKIIIRSLLSEITPNIHEKDNEYSNVWSSQLNDKLSNINAKDISKVIDNNYKNIYDEKRNIDVDNELIGVTVVNPRQKFNWYITNYIGFENNDELQKFLELRRKYDYYEDPIYKIGSELLPSLESIIIGLSYVSKSFFYYNALS